MLSEPVADWLQRSHGYLGTTDLAHQQSTNNTVPGEEEEQEESGDESDLTRAVESESLKKSKSRKSRI